MSIATRRKPRFETFNYTVDVPAGVCGSAEVEKQVVTDEEARFGQLRAAISASSMGRFTPAGHYTGLRINGSLVMSDTPDEIRDIWAPIHYASGRCLVNGLGLGVVVNGMLMNPDCEHVTVIELNSDVIQLVGQHWKAKHGDRLEIINADAMTHKPPRGARYGYVWHDIWPAICSDNLDEMAVLHRRYAKRCDKQGSWCKALCKRWR